MFEAWFLFQLDLAISSFFENDGMEVAEPAEDISPVPLEVKLQLFPVF